MREGIKGGAGLGQQLDAGRGVGSVRSEGGEDGLGVPGSLVQTGLSPNSSSWQLFRSCWVAVMVMRRC